ncbi:hypothetical protein GCG54_00015374 [Colletotrichum gloeosporioides]|uniref:Uncharacterized protein n=1 Tax=Colletotrichum gloeosporioides TaxID=474922 RepID=A0A8H4CQ36_COLGL|nr:uncharacterized protein GCG54_00015374 [Colletotrichum gloeosporioides]KAF3807990.1 hypothetical protein GCG54_00015374 [Colletotrichum gloeosporioides]
MSLSTYSRSLPSSFDAQRQRTWMSCYGGRKTHCRVTSASSKTRSAVRRPQMPCFPSSSDFSILLAMKLVWVKFGHWDASRHQAVARVLADRLVGQFHNTYGYGFAHKVRAYVMGIDPFDASVPRLGRCPFASGAKGNVKTEDVTCSLERMDIITGVVLDKLSAIGKPYGSRVISAIAAKRASGGAKNASKTNISWVMDDLDEYCVSRASTPENHTIQAKRKTKTHRQIDF